MHIINAKDMSLLLLLHTKIWEIQYNFPLGYAALYHCCYAKYAGDRWWRETYEIGRVSFCTIA